MEGIAIETKSPDGKTALHVAAQYGNEELVSILLEHGADIHARSTPKGKVKERKFYSNKNPLHWAAAEGYSSIIQILLEHGASITVSGKGPGSFLM